MWALITIQRNGLFIAQMAKMIFTKKLYFLLGLSIICIHAQAQVIQPPAHEVKIVGQMKNVMWKGQLYGNIHLDTIANKTHLYGLGPVEFLAGEVLIIDGKSYTSIVTGNTTMKVEETYDIKAPFFGYANIANWTELTIPDSIQTIQQLEAFLDKATEKSHRPFMFKITGTVEQATIHIVNLAKGSKVSSPDDAHKGQVNYQVNNEESEIIGFFSTEHQAIFTHHDTFVHMHLMTKDGQKMGHLDKVLFKRGAIKLYVPTQ